MNDLQVKVNEPVFKVFLETSVQHKRLFGLISERKQIEDYIKDKTVYTSAFVLSEFRNLIVTALIELYFLIYNHKEYPTSEAFALFQRMYSYRPGRLKPGFDIAIELLQKKGLPEDRKKALFKLEVMVRNTEREFHNVISPVYYLNNVGYPTVTLRDSSDVITDLSEFYSSIKKTWPVFRASFIKKKISHVQKLVECDLKEYKNIKYGDKREEFFEILMPIYKQCLLDLTRVNDSIFNTKLGDTIIALETPSTATLLTYDGIFQILCAILGKSFYIFDSVSIKEISKKATLLITDKQ